MTLSNIPTSETIGLITNSDLTRVSHTQESTHTPDAQPSSWMRKATMAVALVTAMLGTTSCEKETKIDPIVQVDPNKLTADEQKFADLLAPFPDGTPKSIIVDIPAENPRYSMPGLFKIEMKLINAKAGTYEITPIVSKKPIEDVINKAKEDVPNNELYGVGIAFVIKRADGTTYSPTSTQNIADRDDNNPSTPTPFLAQLPENFTMDEFKKYNPNALATKSYTLNKNEELQLWIDTKAVGKQFATVKLPIKPTEILALAR